MKLFGKNSSTSFFVRLLWLVLFVLSLLLAILFYLNGFVFSDEEQLNDALVQAQRLEYTLETGEVTGSIRESIAAKEAREKAAEEKKREEEQKLADEDTAEAVDTLLEERLILESKKFDEVVSRKAERQFDEVSVTDITKKPAIVVVVTGLGLSTTSTLDALELPKEVTLGFSPYSPQLDRWVREAVVKNHEIMLNIPMQTRNMKTNDPGPYALFQTVSAKDNLTRIKMLLDLVKEDVAVYSDKHEMFSHSASHIEPILKLFLLRKIWYVYGGGHQNATLSQISDKLAYPLLVADLYLDEEIDNAAINEKLQQAKKIAVQKGYAIVFARPYPITIRMLQQWVPMLESQGVNVLPVSKFTGKYIVDKDVSK